MYAPTLPFPVIGLYPHVVPRTILVHAVAGLADLLEAPESRYDHVWDFPKMLGLGEHLKLWGATRSPLVSEEANALICTLFAKTGKVVWLLKADELALLFRAVPLEQTHELVSKANHYWLAKMLTNSGELIMSDSILHPDDAAKIPADVYQRLNMNLEALKTALLNKDPMMPQHLRNSHALLITYPESRHLLSPTAVSTLIGAAQAHMNITIVSKAAAAAVSKSGGGRGKKVSVDDL